RKYEVDIDYYKADIINTKTAAADKGEPLTYHPPIPDMDYFSNHLPASETAVINTRFPDTNFQDWQDQKVTNSTRILSVSSDNWVVLKWNLNEIENTVTESAGILEITTHSLQTGGHYSEVFGEDLGMEFGKVRVIEILEGN